MICRLQHVKKSKVRQQKMLEEARRNLAATEECGDAVLNDLAKQRETIERASDNVRETNDGLKESNRIMNRMSRWWRG